MFGGCGAANFSEERVAKLPSRLLFFLFAPLRENQFSQRRKVKA
jgi:hypothetical protein